MYLGKTAAEAVEIASLFDASCGNGVDTLDLHLTRQQRTDYCLV